MFRGRFVHTIDAKNRMSLPVAFRQEIQRRSDRAPILTNANQWTCRDTPRKSTKTIGFQPGTPFSLG
jgi:DNA-binding transcriptional regulator/RsmH inhibitor MraZ